jgi:hypothetical protein
MGFLCASQGLMVIFRGCQVSDICNQNSDNRSLATNFTDESTAKTFFTTHRLICYELLSNSMLKHFKNHGSVPGKDTTLAPHAHLPWYGLSRTVPGSAGEYTKEFFKTGLKSSNVDAVDL